MLRRVAFRPKLPPARPCTQYTGANPSTPRAQPVQISDGKARLVVPLPKENALQHQGYMALVRQLPCARCGFFRKGFIQFCHADEGKGMAIKTDCRLGWPGCAPHDSRMGCHWYVGTSGEMPRASRRAFERSAGDSTRALIIASGKWPARLPRWQE